FGPAGSMVMTASAASTAFATLPAASAPAFTAFFTAASERSNACTSRPPTTCRAAIPPPMLPRPMNAMRVIVLPHRRDDEARIPAFALRPSCRDGLHLGPELHAFHAVLVGVAEGGALPAAEGVIGDRHRDRHVDADH